MKINLVLIFLMSFSLVACVETIQVPDTVVDQLNEKIDQLEMSVSSIPVDSLVPDSTENNFESEIKALSEKIDQLENEINLINQNSSKIQTNNSSNTVSSSPPMVWTTRGWESGISGVTTFEYKCDHNANMRTVQKEGTWIIDADDDLSIMDFSDADGSYVPDGDCLTLTDDGFDANIHEVLYSTFDVVIYTNGQRFSKKFQIDAFNSTPNTFSLSADLIIGKGDKVFLTYLYSLK
ncbi:MAG: hypothetical protein CL699_06520 [Chloroflexi bacterium]|nr:hypothetical protein [Chloroflexota bacterium]